MPNAETPLAGVRVVEVGRGHAAALVGRLLFDLGAEVVPLGEQAEAAGGFERWVRCRGRPAEPLRGLPGLLATADVLIYDDRGERALAELGIVVAGLVEELPDLVAVRLSPFGLTGPLAGTPATEATLQALAGLTAATGAEADPPLLHRVGLAARTAALSGLLAVGAGLIGRDRGAGGDHYDIAEFDSLLTHLGTLLPTVALTGQRPPRRGNRHAMAAPWNSYRCADSHVMVCSMGEAMWRRLAETIERPDLPDDPRFAESVARVTNVEALDDAITAWTSVRSAADVVAAMRAAGVPAATVSSPAEVRDGELAADRELVAGSPREPRSPVRSLRLRVHRTPDAPAPVGEIRRLPTGAPPLRGLRVVELGAFTAGPGAGRLLAQLGADVLKVEPPHGEGARRLAQRIDGTGYLYFVNNAGKRACRLDLGVARDRATLERKLLADADLLLTNLASDTLAAAGLGPDRVLARHNLVYLGISAHGYGSADRSFDTVIQAESGIMHLVGEDTDGPRRTAVSSVDVLGAYLAAAAAVLATRQRLLTGHAGTVDVALFDVAAWLTQDAWFGEPRPAPPLLKVADDGTVVLDGPGSPQRGDSVTEVLESALAVGTPAAPLLDVTSVVSHPQVLDRSMVVEQRHHDIPFLNLGDHLRSIRRPPRVPAVAPAEQDSPVWLTDVAEPACVERISDEHHT